jgi:hypothetical protein
MFSTWPENFDHLPESVKQVDVDLTIPPQALKFLEKV